MNLDEYQKQTLRTGDNVKLNDYQEAAVKTAIYPTPLVYPTLGLCGEVGELVKSALGQDGGTSKEIGDVMWYAANVANDMGMELSEVCKRKSFPPKGDYWSIDDVLEELSIRCGEVAENVKKTLRDDGGVLGAKRQKNIANALKEIFSLLASIAETFDTTLKACADENIEKLQSRQKRGKLTGDGDNR
jgi:NTP pyrophosphatase (non-canonical NTP hydrolase)